MRRVCARVAPGTKTAPVQSWIRPSGTSMSADCLEGSARILPSLTARLRSVEASTQRNAPARKLASKRAWAACIYLSKASTVGGFSCTRVASGRPANTHTARQNNEPFGNIARLSIRLLIQHGTEQRGGGEGAVSRSVARAGEFPGADREALPDMAGAAHSGLDQLGPPDCFGLDFIAWRGAELLVCALASCRAATGGCRPGAELAGRQPGRNAGARARLPAAALWVLCRPHGGRAGHLFPAGRDGSFGLYESAGGGRPDRKLLPVIDRSVSGDLHHRHVSNLVLEVQPHRAADSADDRQRGAAVPADGANCRPLLAAVRLRRRDRDLRHGGHAGGGGGAAHGVSVSCGTAAGQNGCAVIRWLKFNAVGGMGIAVQLAALALLKSG